MAMFGFRTRTAAILPVVMPPSSLPTATITDNAYG
jgi:hypothetical protein